MTDAQPEISVTAVSASSTKGTTMSARQRLTEKFSHTIVSKSVEYAAIIRALLKDVWATSFYPLLAFLFLALLHIGLVILSFYILYQLVLTVSQALSTASPTDELISSMYLVGVLLATLAAGAGANYVSARTANAIAGNVECVAIKRTLTLYVHLPRYGSRFANFFIGFLPIMRLVTQGAHYCGMTARLLLRAVPNIALACSTFLIMLYLEFWLTLLLVSIAGALTFFQYPTHLGAAGASRKLEREGPEKAKALKNMLEEVNRMGDPATLKDRLIELEEVHGYPGKYIETFYRRLLVVAYGACLATVTTSVVLCIAILVLIYQGMTGKLDLAVLSVYVMAAQRLMVSVTTLSSSFVRVSRFYPYISRYFRFVWSATDRWPLMVPQEDVRDASYKELGSEVANPPLQMVQPLKPGLTYRVFARQGWKRSSAGALVDALGFTTENLDGLKPHIVFAADPKATEDKTGTGHPWRIFLLPAGGKPASRVHRTPKRKTGAAKTHIYFSTYQEKELEPINADVFIVLDPRNWLVLQSASRAEAIDKIEGLSTSEPATETDAFEAGLEALEDE